VLEQIAAAGFRVEFVPDDYSPEGVVEKVRQVAAIVGAKEAGEALAKQVRDELDKLAAILGQAPATPSVLFILTASSGAPLAAGDKTAAGGIMTLAGGRNAVTGYDGYKPLSTEAAIGLDPDLVIVAEHAIPLLGGIEMLPKRADLGQIPAVRDGRVMVVDANYLLGFGPRAVQAARELARRLHPTLAAQLAE
jgi:iron complex transport system substrate-binding protein